MNTHSSKSSLKLIFGGEEGMSLNEIEEKGGSEIHEDDFYDSERDLSMGDISSAKSASRRIRSKSVNLQERKKKDFGTYEVALADYPIANNDLAYSQGRGFKINQVAEANNGTKHQMHPTRKFNADDAKNIIRTILEEALDDKRYEPEFCRFKARLLSDQIKEKVKLLFLPRYKVISKVFMGELGHQSMRVASRCAWDVDADSYAEYMYRNSSLWAVAIVYGVYCE